MRDAMRARVACAVDDQPRTSLFTFALQEERLLSAKSGHQQM